MDIFMVIQCLGTIYFANRDALKGTLVATLKEAQPTVFFGVPRVWEKIMEGMRAKGRETKGLKKTIAMAAKAAGTRYHLEGGNDIQHHLTYAIYNKLVFSKVKEALGLDKCRIFFTGAAPMDKEVS